MNDKNQTETIKKGRFTITKNKNTLNSDLKDIKIPIAREIFTEEKKSIREIFKEEGIDYSQEKEFHSNISDKLDKRFKKPKKSFVQNLKEEKEKSKNQGFEINI